MHLVNIEPHNLTTLNKLMGVNKIQQTLITVTIIYIIIMKTVTYLVRVLFVVSKSFLLQSCKTRQNSSVSNYDLDQNISSPGLIVATFAWPPH